MSYRSHTAAPSRVFDHLYDPIFTTSDPKNIYKENCIALTRSAPIHVYPVYRSMFSELNHEQRNCYAYQKNVLPHFSYSSQTVASTTNFSVSGADRAKFFSNPMGNIRTINVGLTEERIESVEETQIIKYKSTTVQTAFRLAAQVDRLLIKFHSTFFSSHQGVERTDSSMVTRNNMLHAGAFRRNA